MKYIAAITMAMALLPFYASTRCVSNQKKESTDSTDKHASNGGGGGKFRDSFTTISTGIGRCSNGYLEVCKGSNPSGCSWSSGNAQQLQEFKDSMIKGADGMEKGAQGMEKGFGGGGGGTMHQDAKDMRSLAENCKVKG
jgi:hypothetical protein